MNFTHFKAGADDSGRRLDRLLRKFLSEENLPSIYKSLRKGLIKVDGKKCNGNFHVSEGSDIQIADFLLPQKSESCQDKTQIKNLSGRLSEITILKNEFLLILNKPYDIPVQPAASFKGESLSERVQADFQASGKMNSLSFKTGPLHRLDRKTTGLLAFSQNLQGAQWFSQKIKSHEIQKVYLALLEGNLCQNQIWKENIQKMENAKLKAENGKRKAESFSFGKVSGFGDAGTFETKSLRGAFHTVSVSSDGEGKAAYTEVFPLSHGIFEGKEVTLARILIKTGRTHQIRAQAAFHGYPLLGDTAYGSGKIDSKKWGQDFFLHASELHFPDANSLNLPKMISAPLPKAFENILNSI